MDRLDLLKRRHPPVYTDRGLYGLLKRTPDSYEPPKHRTYTVYRCTI